MFGVDSDYFTLNSMTPDSEEISIHTSCWTMAKRTFFLLVVLGFSAMWQAADAQIVLNKPVLIGPPRSLLGSVEFFFCKMDNISTNQAILYGLYNEDDPDKFIGEYCSQHKEEATFPLWIRHDYDGKLICKASVENNSEVLPVFSDPMVFEVVVPVDGVHIISSPFLKNLWEGDSLTLLCNISQGTYVLYSWFLNNTLLHNDSSNNQLTIPHLSSQDSGTYTCRATQELNETHSLSIMSEGRNVSVKGFEEIPLGVIAVVFCCFLFVMIVGGACCIFCRKNPEREMTDSSDHVHCHEHINPENHHTMPETLFEPQVKDMETVMEVEL